MRWASRTQLITPEGPSIDVIHTQYAVAAHPVLFMDLLRFYSIFANVRTFLGPKAPTPGILPWVGNGAGGKVGVLGVVRADEGRLGVVQQSSN